MNPPPKKLVSISAWILAILLCVAILIRWIPGMWINPTLFQLGLFLLLGVWGIRMVYRPFTLCGSFALLPLGIVTIWGLFQLAFHTTVSRWETGYAVLTWSGNFAAFFLALQICHSTRVRRRFLQTLLIFGFLITVVSVLQLFSSPDKIFWVFEDWAHDFGPFQSRDRYAAFAELIMPIALLQALQKEDKQKALWYTGIAATLFAAVIAGMSRAGAILITFESMVVLLIAARKRRSNAPEGVKMTTAKFVLATSIFTAVVGVSALLQRFDDPDPYGGRREMTISALQMAQERPWFGFGLGNFPNAYPKYAVWDIDKFINHAHDDWAEWAAEGGIPFFVMMLAIFVWAVPKAFQSLWGIGILTVFVHSLVDFPLQDPAIEFWVSALLGVLATES